MSTDINEKFKALMLTDLTNTVSVLKADFMAMEEMSMARIPEIIFVRDFLPMFAGEVPYNQDLIAVWYQISGGAFNRVNIVDRKGDVVNTVPPIIDRNVLPTDNKRGESTYSLFVQHESLSQISPMAAQGELSNQLTHKYIPTVGNDVNDSPLKLEWSKLFAAYGKKNVGNAGSVMVIDDEDHGMVFDM